MRHQTLLSSALLFLVLATACRKEAAPASADLAARCNRISNDPLPEVIAISDHQTGLPVEKEFLAYNGNIVTKETIVRYGSGTTDTTFAKFNETSDGYECLVYYGGTMAYWQKRVLFTYDHGQLVTKSLNALLYGRNAALTYNGSILSGFSSNFFAAGLGGDREEQGVLNYAGGRVNTLDWTYIINGPSGTTTQPQQFTYPALNPGHFKEVSNVTGPRFDRKANQQVYSPYVYVARPEILYQPRFDPAYFATTFSTLTEPILADLVDGGTHGLNSRFAEDVSYWSDGNLTVRNTYKVKKTNRQHQPTEFQITDINGHVNDVRIKYTRQDEE